MPVLALCIVFSRSTWREKARSAIQVSVGALSIGISILALLGVRPGTFISGYILEPLQVGGGRVERLLGLSSPHMRYVVWPVWWAPLFAFVGVSAAVLVLHVRAARRGRCQDGRSLALDLAAAVSLVVASVLYACLTFRSAWTSLGWLPCSFGLVLSGIAWQPSRGLQALQIEELHRGNRFARQALLFLSCLGLVLGTFWFNDRVNRPRSASLMSLSGPVAVQPMPAGLEWLDLATPSFTKVDASSLFDLVGYLQANPGTMFLLGDSTILYPLTERCSISPALWFHPGLTVPWSGSQATVSFQRSLIGRLESNRLRFFVVENGGTQMGVTLETLPLVRDWLDSRSQRRLEIGAFEIFELRETGFAANQSSRKPGGGAGGLRGR